MAGRVVTVLERRAWLLVLGLALAQLSACSSFHPVSETRHTLLDDAHFRRLGMDQPYWHAYDDQHSHTSPCTNGATGNHLPSQCARIDPPPSFSWEGGKCPPSDAQKRELEQKLEPVDGRICLQGTLDGVLSCVDKDSSRCIDTGGDNSNMWGAGVGLEFSSDGKQEWDGLARGFTGLAFDLTILPEGSALNLRVELPVALDPNTVIPDKHPLMRDDGSVIATDGRVYGYDCDADQLLPGPQLGLPIKLCQALVADDGDCRVTSNQHPFGSPFWLSQDRDPTYRPSPIRAGHNEFTWQDVVAPPLDGTYDFERGKMLGIHFHVVHTENPTEIATSSSFHFCIENLALLQQ